MKTLEEIVNDVKERQSIIVNILSFHRDFEFLSNPQSPDMVKFFAKNPIFFRSKKAFYNTICVEIHKLFSDSKNDDFRFNRMMDDIGEFRLVHPDFLSDAIVNDLASLLESARQNESIKSLKIIRDKYLAHTDKDRDQFLVSLKDRPFKDLINISTQIIDILRREILSEKTTIQAYLQEDGYKELEVFSKSS